MKKKRFLKKKKLKITYLGIKKLLWSKNIQIENLTREAVSNIGGYNLTVKNPQGIKKNDNYLNNYYVNIIYIGTHELSNNSRNFGKVRISVYIRPILLLY